ncbi:DNA internalization-related competence protein ComEC/Rec2 [uncultured Psychromonas sp.]|uniref:DNA internalization-related competence protein ComEC/Rec2 n=1 Tax=uncultured Psychromonas sp. TaxID=173974 RepID=UPI002615C047|nr:DNA internalization-related competence protein ComEC/Rec2 [uncultured Psychromonas sp.]
MRITIWLSIVTFISTLYWPQLLNTSGMLSCALVLFVFLCWPRWRYLSAIPLTALYFSSFVYMTFLGGSVALVNPNSIAQNKYLLNNNNHKSSVNFISDALDAQDNNITVRIKSLINTKNSGYFIARITAFNGQACHYCPLIEMRWFRPVLQVQAGQIHQFKVRLKALQGNANPSGFDRQKWRYSQHIAYIASIKTHLNTIDPSLSLRAKLYQKILQVTDSMSQQGSLIALIFADKSLMSVSNKNSIKELGIAHLFAISGLHIGLLFIFSFVIFNGLLKKVLPGRFLGWFSWRLVNTLSFFVCIGYGYISGFSLPTQRALLMLLLGILMLSSKRKVSLLDLLVLCFWFMLLFDPLAILSSSLWLSFVAMSSILVFMWSMHRTEHLNRQDLPWWKTLLQNTITFIKGLVLLQLVLTLFMLPIQLVNFSAISLFSLFINLIAIPLFSWFIIPFTLLGSLILLIIEPIGVLFLSISNNLLEIFLDYASGLTLGYLALSDLTVSLILSTGLCILLCLFLWLLKRFFVVSQTLLSILIITFFSFIVLRITELKWDEQNTWQVEVFDVGQGLAVLVKSEGEVLLYDTGPSYSSDYAVADSTILPYLNARGITELDYLFVSHSDNDHAGGVFAIQDKLTIKNTYAGEAALMHREQIVKGHSFRKFKQCLAGQSFRLGKLTLKVLSPSKVGKNNNDNSCVIKISDGHKSVLLTGDISKVVEQKLVSENTTNQEANLKADILIAPHHGSKTSSSLAFIKQVQPDWVVFSAGYKNRWRFPILSVVERYQLLNVEHLTTANTGFIRFNVENQHIDVKTYREDLASYWYHRHLAF